MAGVIHVLPIGADLDVAEGESVLDAARRQGWRWPTVCLGDMQCGICWFEVVEGADHMSLRSSGERAKLAELPGKDLDRARLACQVRLSGPATVTRRGARPNRPAR